MGSERNRKRLPFSFDQKLESVDWVDHGAILGRFLKIGYGNRC